MASTAYLAFDLGAESGRALLGRLDHGCLQVDEIHRFANTPIQENGSLRWDIPALWREMQHALALAAPESIAAIGVDTWGVDYALLDACGHLLENPYHYRDRRNAAAMAEVLRRVPKEEIYAITGVQFLSINTINQLFAARTATPALLAAADRFVMMPDLFNAWLTGVVRGEYTDASTSQLMDARTRTWATGLMERLDLPSRLAPPLVEPGTILGSLRPECNAPLAGTHVVAVGSHDTASAVAAITARDGTAFISSGTWSLVGTELDAPVLTRQAMDMNFSNEGGVGGTTRLLKNVTGLWLLQGCRRAWAKRGRPFTYAQLTEAAAAEPPLRHHIDPDDDAFVNPDDMLDAIDAACRRTGQAPPASPGAYARAVFEGLARKYRGVLRDLEQLIDRRIERIRVIGGGSQNALLNQLTADAVGVPVVAGPVEATALGNLAMQLLATGAAKSLSDARALIDRSFPTRTFDPQDVASWQP